MGYLAPENEGDVILCLSLQFVIREPPRVFSHRRDICEVDDTNLFYLI